MRLIGQDVSVSVLQDGNLLSRLNRIVSNAFEFESEIIQAGYLNEKSDRFDSVFIGVKIDIEFHLEGMQALTLIDAIVAKAMNRRLGTLFSVGSRFAFPNGETALLSFPDVTWESIPLEAGGRAELVSMKLTGRASEFKITAR